MRLKRIEQMGSQYGGGVWDWAAIRAGQERKGLLHRVTTRNSGGKCIVPSASLRYISYHICMRGAVRELLRVSQCVRLKK